MACFVLTPAIGMPKNYPKLNDTPLIGMNSDKSKKCFFIVITWEKN